jgi:hypothetical protein
VRYKKNKRSNVYLLATFVAMIIFLPLQNHAWAVYAGACAGYTVLVFGLRRIKKNSRVASAESAMPESGVLLTHLTFLAIVCGWVWLCIVLKPYLPYFLTTEDTNRPYFGLAFLGTVGLFGLEAIEEHWLKPDMESSSTVPKSISSQHSTTTKK